MRVSKKVLKSFGDDLQRIAHRKTPMALSVGATGGYLVPPELALAIDEGFQEASIFMAQAYVQPMTREEITLPRVSLTASHSAGTSPLFGGVAISWFKEGASIPESEPTFQGVTLRSRNAGILVYASDNLVADGGEALATYVQFVAASAIAFAVDYKCFNGNGVAEPLGILNSPARYRQTRAVANHVSQQDLANMIAHLIPACFNRSIWCCHPTALADIMNLSSFFVNGDKMYLLGRPLFVTEKVPPLGTEGDVTLLDPKLYALGNRLTDFAVSDQVGFLNRQTVFRFIWRGDGQPLTDGTATLADGTSSAGVFVSLN